MGKPLRNAKASLARRQAGAPKKTTNMYNEPGSMNAHKSYPSGNGRRTHSQIKAASQQATNR